jgi:mRNA interferase RelE/StbE
VRRYKVDVHHKAARAILELPRPDQVRVARKIDLLAEEPRPEGVEKLTDTRNGYRIRSGDYRIVYTVDDAILVVNVVRVAHRREVYRRM